MPEYTQKVKIDSVTTWAGTNRPEIRQDGESIIRKNKLNSYLFEKYAVTAERFSEFVKETGYETDAEKYGWSYVFKGLIEDLNNVQIIGHATGVDWWLAVKGACWKKPIGPSEAEAQGNHPATHISWNDACAFASWSGGRLPSEIEWEHAARSGTDEKRYPWGDQEPDDEHIFCNIWQGRFPENNLCADGFYGTAPVDSFQPNEFGIFNMSGNVWEWTSDNYYIKSLKSAAQKRNKEARKNDEKVIKGGSFLCHASYCWRYRIAARSGRAPDTSASHTGMRVVYPSEK